MKMKNALVILSLSALAVGYGQSAVVSLDVGVSAFSYSGKTVDLDSDGTTDFTFIGNGGICTTDYPTSTCVFAVTLKGTEGVEFLFDPSLAGPARPLVPGDILGGSSSPGVWGAAPYSSLSVSAVMHMLDPDPANSGYADFLDGFEAYSIGFRQLSEGGEFRYGWIDVGLSTPVLGGDGSTQNRISIPQVIGIHFADTPGEEVAFIPVPEPGSIMLLALPGALALKRKRPTNRRDPLSAGSRIRMKDRT